ncbi:ATP-binding protein [Kribbella sp. NPDC050281]|uniref:AAA family ATPase n=1 Tax=Kribbella sp. NPDC050281 TaxID=3155515 RepID=UPI0033DC31DF
MLMCGTAYSGKSTYAQALAAKVDAVVVSLDEINERRGLWGGDGIPVEEWIRTHELAGAEVRALLAAGRTVIVDDTSSLRSLRDGWRSLAAGAEFLLIYLDVNHTTIRRRQAGNRISGARGDVTDGVLEHHLADFEPPGPDESPVRV